MRRLLVLVSAIAFVDLLFYAAITPLLPWYAERFDLSKTGAGVLAGAYAAGTLLGALPGGWLTTRIGSRRTVLVGLALLSAASLGFGLGRSIVLLDAMRFLQGLGGACTWAGAFGWVLSQVPPEQRGRTIGTIMSAALVGLLVGPALGALAHAIGPEAPFAGVAALGVVLALAALRIPPAPTLAVRQPLLAVLGDRAIWLGLFLVAVPALVFGVVEVLVPLALDELGATSGAIAATFVVASAIQAIVHVVSGRVSDRHGRLRPIRVCLVGVFVFLLVVPLPETVWLLAGVVVVGCVLVGALDTPAMALLSDSVAAARVEQGVGFGLANLAWAGGQVVGTIGGAALAGATSDAVPYVLLAGLCVVAFVVVAAQVQRDPVAVERA